jgi:hypothetical protein
VQSILSSANDSVLNCPDVAIESHAFEQVTSEHDLELDIRYIQASCELCPDKHHSETMLSVIKVLTEVVKLNSPIQVFARGIGKHTRHRRCWKMIMAKVRNFKSKIDVIEQKVKSSHPQHHNIQHSIC